MAVALTFELEPDYIFMDIAMPRVDELTATRRIRELPLSKQPLIVAITAWGGSEDRLAAEESGCDVHLLKPVELEVLQKLLEAGSSEPSLN